jgi:hypothetical protein
MPKSEDVQIFVRITQEMERIGLQTFWYGEALGIREMVIRPPFKSVHEAYANVGQLAEQLIGREVQG